MSEPTIPFQTAGSIDFQELGLFGNNGRFMDIKDFCVELNLFEDLFSNALNGNILISDSRNLLKELPIIGEEFLYVKFKTPNTEVYIDKIFRIYSVTNREIVRDRNTQTYILNFISFEAIVNETKPIFRTFSGKVTDIVEELFNEYIQTNRFPIKKGDKFEFPDNPSKIQIFNDTANQIKFVSPGWTPFKCINWCASRSIPKEGKACNFLFFESNKSFNFTSIEHMFYLNNETDGKFNIGDYIYNVNQIEKNKNPIDKLFNVEEFQVVKTVDHLDNFQSGYLANRLITLDVKNKIYTATDYDADIEFQNYDHSEKNARPIFDRNSVKSPLSDIMFKPVHPGLFEGIENNANERAPEIYGNRKSNLKELDNFKLNLIVPGRTDVEVGRILKFIFPDVSPKTEKDSAKPVDDKYYSGFYLISAIRHKITLTSHFMSMEIVKDSLKANDEDI